MNMDKLARAGEPPWLPYRKATELDVWYAYECPLAGTFKLDDQVVLFTNINGAHDRLSVWAYTYLSDDDVAGLDNLCFETTQELHAFIDEKFHGRTACFSLASNLEITEWAPGDVVDGSDGLLDAATTFLEHVLDAHTSSTSARFNASLSVLDELDSEASDLVDA